MPPEIIDWADVKGFRYKRSKKSELQHDLSLLEYLGVLDKPALTIEVLKRTRIFLISAKTDDISSSWIAYQCLYAEIDLGERFFVLNNGKWYEVDQSFTQVIKRNFSETPRAKIEFIDYETSFNNENEYNLALSKSILGSCCLDARNIHHAGGYNKFEFCDVLTADKQLIHVKRYSGSAQLSHLFAQGVTSGELFAGDAEFREKLNKELPDPHKLNNPVERPDTTNYEIIYGIISKSGKDLDIPFFSKVTLKNAKSRLEGLGYKVSIAKIRANLGEDNDDVIDGSDLE